MKCTRIPPHSLPARSIQRSTPYPHFHLTPQHHSCPIYTTHFSSPLVILPRRSTPPSFSPRPRPHHDTCTPPPSSPLVLFLFLHYVITLYRIVMIISISLISRIVLSLLFPCVYRFGVRVCAACGVVQAASEHRHHLSKPKPEP